MEPRFNDLRYNDILGITINIRLPSKSYSKMYGAGPRYNDIPGITINIRLPSKSCSKTYGAEPRYNDLRYNDIPGLTMEMSSESKIFLVYITIKSISQTTGNTSTVHNKQTFITLTITIINVSVF